MIPSQVPEVLQELKQEENLVLGLSGMVETSDISNTIIVQNHRGLSVMLTDKDGEDVQRLLSKIRDKHKVKMEKLQTRIDSWK